MMNCCIKVCSFGKDCINSHTFWCLPIGGIWLHGTTFSLLDRSVGKGSRAILCKCIINWENDWTWEFASLMNNDMVHIGQLIRIELVRQHHSVTWFAQAMACSRTSAYNIFEKPSIDTDLLLRISAVLEVDFFKVYSQELEKIKNNVIP